MKKSLLFVGVLLCGFTTVKAQGCSELFISEYVEGTGNDKAIELYNPTGSAISLTGYRIERFSNGSATSSTGGVLNLTGSVAPYSTFIIVNGQTTSTQSSPAVSLTLQGMADQLDGAYPAPTYMNGNDAIALFKNSTMIDLIGKTGDGSMTSSNGWGNESPYDGSVGKIWTENHTLIRKASVKSGVTVNPDPFIVSAQWDSLPKDTWTNLGMHTCDCYVGIKEISNSVSFAVYPNPSENGTMTISASEGISSIEIIDLLGKVIYSNEFEVILKSTVLNNAVEEKGVYIVRVRFSNNEISQTQFIVK